jgi:hypothetical protein
MYLLNLPLYPLPHHAVHRGGLSPPKHALAWPSSPQAVDKHAVQSAGTYLHRPCWVRQLRTVTTIGFLLISIKPDTCSVLLGKCSPPTQHSPPTYYRPSALPQAHVAQPPTRLSVRQYCKLRAVSNWQAPWHALHRSSTACMLVMSHGTQHGRRTTGAGDAVGMSVCHAH